MREGHEEEHCILSNRLEKLEKQVLTLIHSNEKELKHGDVHTYKEERKPDLSPDDPYNRFFKDDPIVIGPTPHFMTTITRKMWLDKDEEIERLKKVIGLNQHTIKVITEEKKDAWSEVERLKQEKCNDNCDWTKLKARLDGIAEIWEDGQYIEPCPDEGNCYEHYTDEGYKKLQKLIFGEEK